jgi:uncharacterized protein YbjT (DUF2867 family)
MSGGQVKCWRFARMADRLGDIGETVMRIILAGASGLVGGFVARQADAVALTCISRRHIDGLDSRAKQVVAPSDQWADAIAAAGCDVAIAALGTTIRAAGSKPAFAAVDLDLVSSFAKAARAAGARQFMLVSSVGANANAANFYLSVKGKAEAAVQALGFERVDIFRPGLLRGDRQENRPGEAIAMMVSPLTDLLTPRLFDKYRSIAASQVADAIVRAVGAAETGVFVHHNREMVGG